MTDWTSKLAGWITGSGNGNGQPHRPLQELGAEEALPYAPLLPTWEEGDDGGHLVVNIGPQHPSTHGVLRLIVELAGERIVRLEPDIGYLHTGVEKTFEHKRYTQGITLTNRLDYLSPHFNSLAFVMAAERLLGIEPPPRAQYARVIICELTRIASHLVWLGTHAIDVGAMSMLLYCFREREMILDIHEMVSGARMMSSYFRIGGLARDLPAGFEEAVREFIALFPDRLADYETLLTNNPIWLERTKGVGVITAEEALAHSVTGPILRAAGVPWDIRKAFPYSGYERFDFDVPIRAEGDIYARYLVRLDEMRESSKIVTQALDNLPAGPVLVDNHKVAPPPKEEIYQSMEALIHHFKFWTEGVRVPAGEVYACVESPRGELGVYMVSDGSSRPWRVHFRGPSFANLQILGPAAKGGLIADMVALVASMDPVLGDVDR
ncbi:MAG: NADH-quinone oxidoreductase subunit D [Chloroflexi bacterium]|nr:NADH-quinone oxidoreductase subunit D [Chloroflexota bacterium]